ncbi:MAG: hypothetical protein HC934_03050 [Acaryochloridaceae cyanobacterium SU_2_1]|nr:hypothetical protein [Acaryochloridaceae cyanobacterium SU_2_1]
MTNGDNIIPSHDSLDAIKVLVSGYAERSAGDSIALLELLRTLEALHKEIREDLFLQTLPSNRHGLDLLLREIEAKGGWPYIPRMRLKAFLANF